MITVESWIDTKIDVPDERHVQTVSSKHRYFLLVILLSLLAHLLILWGASQSHVPVRQPDKMPAMKATLVFTPKPVPEKASLEDNNELPLPETSAFKPAPADANQPETHSDTMVTESIPVPAVAKEEATETEITLPQADTSQIDTASAADNASRYSSKITQNTLGFIRQKTSEVSQQLVENAMRSRQTTMYQQQRPADWVYEEKTLEQKLVKKVNCDNTTSKGLAILSGMLGGTVRCSDSPQLDGFIDKRLKKR
ncbi:MAG: hypothetical protein ACFHVJ_07415 [Aestuariibacter sp.]